MKHRLEDIQLVLGEEHVKQALREKLETLIISKKQHLAGVTS
jgi:hypothetical protein